MKNFLTLILIIALVFSCAKVPLTGRSQLALVESSEIQPLVNEEYDKVLKEGQVLTNSPEGRQIVSVGNKIASSVEDFLNKEGYSDLAQSFEWEFNLLKNAAANAWCMPGGKVAFYTGILPITQNETGIAVVMGHEIAHAVASHSRERMSSGLLTNFGMSVLSTAMGSNPTLTEAIFLQSVGMGSELGMLAFSRKHELEADELGLIFMAMAGYDPREAPVFWERMASQGGEVPPEFLSTHPGPENRQAKLEEQMERAMQYYRGEL